MQVQHEAQLLESLALKAEDLAPNLQLDAYTLVQAKLASVEHLASCPAANLIAVHCNRTNQIILIDTKTHAKRDRFALKSCDKRFSRHSFTVKGIDFSPDGTRLAVGQSDCIIYIYKLCSINQANNQLELLKPVITGKFACASPVTCLIWTELGIVFGTQDGRVRLISALNRPTQHDSNQSSSPSSRVSNLYSSNQNSMPISLAAGVPFIAIGFIDCTVSLVRLANDQFFNESSSNLGNLELLNRRNGAQVSASFFEHTCPPYCLALVQTNALLCAGPDGRIAIHSIKLDSTHHSQTNVRSSEPVSTKTFCLNWIQNIDMKEDVVAINYSVINEILAVATSSRLTFIKYDQESDSWRLQSSYVEIKNTFSLTSVAWTRDGSQLLLGSLLGTLELFQCSWNKQSLGEQLEICHIAKNRVRITGRSRNLLATYKSKHEIRRVNLLDNGQSVIIWTLASLLLARLGQSQSEIEWSRDKGAKFNFDHEGFVLIHTNASRELLVVKLGHDGVVYREPIELILRETICARSYERSLIANESVIYNSGEQGLEEQDGGEASDQVIIHQIQADESSSGRKNEIVRQRLAYVAEQRSLVLVDLQTKSKVFTRVHQESIDLLRLSHTSEFLFYKDAKRRLYLTPDCSNDDQTRAKLLAEDCEFSSWIEGADILVVQSGSEIKIWYDIRRLARVTTLDSRKFNINNSPPIIDLSLTKSMKPYPVIVQVDRNQLKLSNEYLVPLDAIKVEFYTQCTSRRLESALAVLLDRDSQLKYKSLWTELGWLAVGEMNCTVAIRAFQQLSHTSLVSYLESCAEKPEELEWRLAMLRGDWTAFETILDPERVVATYKRLNKWSRVIDFLARAQQFRQRDIAEEEHREWLVGRQRYVEAARIQARGGDLVGAIELLFGYEKFEEAASLMIGEQTLPLNRTRMSQAESRLRDTAKRLAFKLIENGKFTLAAHIHDAILCDQKEAFGLFLRGESYDRALELARLVAPDRLAEINESYGHFLLQAHRQLRRSRRAALPAVEHFLAANKGALALDAAIELGDFCKALEILKTLDDGKGTFTDQSSQIANLMLKNGNPRGAIEALLIGKHYGRAVELNVELADFRGAFEVSLEFVNANDRDKTSSQFVQLADDLSKDGKHHEAESIYLMLDRPQLAVQMHREAQNYDRMVEILDRFLPDLLESNLLLLARDLEREGKFEEAERYMLRASDSEWTNVVRMYRLAGRWGDAYRVARAHCSSVEDPLLVQLAYWWSKSLDNIEAARALLASLAVGRQVLEFCCENRSFQFALDLCAASDGLGADERVKGEVAKRYAAFLESKLEFGQAEEVLLRFGLIEAASRMYIDNGMHTDAVRVVEQSLARCDQDGDQKRSQRLAELFNQILIECANKLVEEERQTKQFQVNGLGSRESIRLNQAQQMYFRAQKPEFAVEMYKKLGMWQQAIQVAQRFAPQLLENVERDFDAQVADEIAPIVLMNKESSGRGSRSSSGSGSLLPDEIRNSTSVVAKRRSVLETLPANNPIDRLQEQAESSIRDGDLRGAQVALGQFLTLLAEGSETTRDETTLGQVNEWLTKLELMLAQPNDPELSVQLWPKVFALADRIAGHCGWGRASAGELLAWLHLRNMLAGYLDAAESLERASGTRSAAMEELERRLLLAHYVSLHGCLVIQLERNFQRQQRIPSGSKQRRQQQQLAMSPSQMERLASSRFGTESSDILRLLSRLSLSLLRFTDLLEARGAFYNAGLWLLAAGRRELARLVWSRLVELAETNEPASADRLLAASLRQMGVPSEQRVGAAGSSGASFVAGGQLAEVRGWLLDSLMEGHQQSAFSLNLDQRGLFESCLLAGRPPRPLPSCLVCGYPVFAGSDQLVLGERFGRSRQVLRSQWRSLLLISRLAETGARSGLSKTPLARLQRQQDGANVRQALEPSVLLEDVIDFVARFSGANERVGSLASL